MPAPQHVKVTWSGVLGTIAAPAEIWSFGLSLDVLGAFNPTDANYQTFAAGARDAWGVHVAPLVGSLARLTRTRVARVASTGLVERNPQGAYRQFDVVGDVPGLGNVNLPFQVALAISTQSLTPGPTGRGRFYLPQPLLGTLETGRISATQQNSIADQMKAFLDAVNNEAFLYNVGPLVIASGGSVVKGLPPALHRIERLRVGRVPDTIRTRRGDLDEAYVDRFVI